MQQWPDSPIVPDVWVEGSEYHLEVVAALTEGFCPKHARPLIPATAFCDRCDLYWELTSSAGTISTFSSAAVYPFAVSDGTTVLVSRL